MKNNKFPLQVVEEMRFNKVYRKWITPITNIDYENNIYRTIQPFHDDWIKTEKEYIKEKETPYHFNKWWILSLFNTKTCINRGTQIRLKENDDGVWYDNIRNPTLEEIKFINGIFKINGYKFNRKTSELTKI